MMSSRVPLMAAVFCLLLAGGVSAQSADEATDTLQALADRIDELDQQLRILARKAELQREADSIRVAAQSTLTVGADGATWRAPDGSFTLKLRGYVHQDSRFFNDDTPNGTDAFLLRRVRPIIEAVSGPFAVRLMPDFGGGTTVLQDAYIDANITKTVQLRGGKFKPAVGLERLQSATAMRFVERALPTALVPNRDVGIQLQAATGNGLLTGSVGVFNGVGDGGSVDTDINDGKEVVVRAAVQPFAGVMAGVAVSRGDNTGIVGATGLTTYRAAAQLDVFAFRTGTTASTAVLANGRRERTSAHGTVYRGPLGLLGEYVTSSTNVLFNTTAAELTNNAWQISGGYVLTGEASTFGGVRPQAPLDPAKGTWGAVEVVARVHALDVDDDVFPIFADSTRSVTAVHAYGAGVNWYWNRNVKFVLSYDHAQFDGGATGGDRPSENLLFLRLQFGF